MEFALHEKIFNAFRFIERGFFDNSFDFFEVSESGTCLNVFKVNVRIVGLRKNIAQEQQKSFVCSELLKNLD